MPQFIYRARDSSLNLVEGTVDADNETAAILALSNQGVFPLMLTRSDAPSRPVDAPSSPSASTPPARRRVPAGPLAYLSRQLADLLSGGLPLFNALTLLVDQTEHKLLRTVVLDLGDAVRDGQPFSDALARHPNIFSPLYLSMVRAGEAGGGLDAVLNRLADLLESESELRSRITSALIYPCVVLVVGVLTVGVLLTYVVPKIAGLFLDIGQTLPLPTRILLAISGVLSHWWWVVLVAGMGGIWMLRRARDSGAGRAAIDRMKLALPLAGTLERKIQTARFTRNLGVMFGQGVPMLQALDVAGTTVSNAMLRRAISGLKDAVQEGGNLSTAMAASGQFPAFVSNLVSVGEESGTLESALVKIATSYEREADRTLRVLTTVMEPLLIVIVGLVVMFIVISMLLPIFELGLVAQ
jgi:type II secretion system protein F